MQPFLGVCLPCVKPSTASSSFVRRSASVLFCRFFLTLSSVSWYADAALRLPEDRSICCLAANAAPRFLPLLKRKFLVLLSDSLVISKYQANRSFTCYPKGPDISLNLLDPNDQARTHSGLASMLDRSALRKWDILANHVVLILYMHNSMLNPNVEAFLAQTSLSIVFRQVLQLSRKFP